MEYLSYIGALSLVGGLGYLTYLMVVKIRWRNPIKRYIKKVVLDYLKELQND
jgi:hypothetical protein